MLYKHFEHRTGHVEVSWEGSAVAPAEAGTAARQKRAACAQVRRARKLQISAVYTLGNCASLAAPLPVAPVGAGRLTLCVPRQMSTSTCTSCTW